MADWIRMPFRVVSGVGLGMGVLGFGGDRRRGRGSLGVNTTQITSLYSVKDWLSYDIVRFKIEVGVEEKFMCKA